MTGFPYYRPRRMRRTESVRTLVRETSLSPATSILAYSVKYASAFYGPFRDVAESTPQFGDRCSYQMDPASVEEGLRETRLDIAEGADIIMVKPALAYLDVIQRVKSETRWTVCAYHVSSEYAMVMAAGERGWLDADCAMREVLLSIRRAGADMIITYYARQIARGASA
ncbi:hypothetical protein BH23GEM3_BH23GEM3_00880 [soil metagenome]|nr:hypothetical protein [Gemmatimonadota bacterium]